MPDQIFIGTLDGVARLRTVVPSQDAADPNLPERYVTFDSTDLGRLRLIANGVLPAASIPNITLSYGDGWQRACKWIASPATSYAWTFEPW